MEKKNNLNSDFKYPDIPFGECLIHDGWLFPGEVTIFKFNFDYISLAE
jgi:hypothetical protein